MNRKNSFLLISGMILIAAFTRLWYHWPNFTAIGAISLFGAAFLKSRQLAILIPFVALFLSDLVLNNTIFQAQAEGFTIIRPGSGWIYLAVGLIVLFGKTILNKVTPLRFLGGAIGATAIFFLLTNLGHWAGPFRMHPLNLSGLIATYVDGIPFVLNTLAGNIFYGAILFGVHEWVAQRKFISDTQFGVDKY